VEESGRRRLFFSSLEVRVYNGAGSSHAGKVDDEVGSDAFLQEGRKGSRAERRNGQVLRGKRGCEDGGAEGRDNEIMILLRRVII
jgi:hypothetical protein